MLLALLLMSACGGGGGDPDAPSSGNGDGSAMSADSSSPTEIDAHPMSADFDAATTAPPDAAPPPSPDAPPAWAGEEHVHILIDNFCNTSADPPEFTVPAGETLQLTWHNHSVDYDADVWLSYGGGYLGLVPGDTWADPFEFCSSPGTYDAAADVSIAGGGGDVCPAFRVWIHCL